MILFYLAVMNGIIYEMESTECVEYLQQNGYAHRICDGMMDCRDFSDEVDCNYCPEERLHCGVGAACIDFKQRCDGIVDCPNGSDERGCCKSRFISSHFNKFSQFKQLIRLNPV